MRRFLRNWQGAVALALSALTFYLSGALLHWLDPTAGTFDLGYLQRACVATAYYLAMTFTVWLVFQIDFPTLDRWLDRGELRQAWAEYPHKLPALLCIIAFLHVAYLACLWLVPV
jgi:hypothetical protein